MYFVDPAHRLYIADFSQLPLSDGNNTKSIRQWNFGREYFLKMQALLIAKISLNALKERDSYTDPHNTKGEMTEVAKN